jgi:hypothetical protein
MSSVQDSPMTKRLPIFLAFSAAVLFGIVRESSAAAITLGASSNPFFLDYCAEQRTTEDIGAGLSLELVCVHSDYGSPGSEVTTARSRITTNGGLSFGT